MSHSALSRRLYLFWLPIILFIFGAVYLSQNHYKPEKEAQYGLQRLNYWRKQAGLQPLELSPNLQKAAQNHALYLTKDADGHDEPNRSNPHFTGNTPQDRAIAVGYHAPVAENLTLSNFARSGKRSVDGLMTALYHRLALLHPDDNEAGAAWANGKNHAFVVVQGDRQFRELCEQANQASSGKRYILTIKCGTQTVEIPIDKPPVKQQMAVKYPIGKNIEPTYDGTEKPNPMPNQDKTGNPISIAFHGEQSPITVMSFTLSENGTPITAVKLLDANNDPNRQLSKTEFALFPLEPLKFATTYQANFRYRQDGQEKVETWSFTTRKKRHILEF